MFKWTYEKDFFFTEGTTVKPASLLIPPSPNYLRSYKTVSMTVPFFKSGFAHIEILDTKVKTSQLPLSGWLYSIIDSKHQSVHISVSWLVVEDIVGACRYIKTEEHCSLPCRFGFLWHSFMRVVTIWRSSTLHHVVSPVHITKMWGSKSSITCLM